MVEPKVIKSSRKTLSIEVNKSGELIVRAPYLISKREIESFLERNYSWINTKLAEMKVLNERTQPKKFVNGEQFLYLGEKYPLRVVKRQRESVLLDKEFRISQARLNNARALFEKWYRKEAKSLFPDRVKYYATEAGLRFKDIKVSGARTRWGSCSHDNNLNFTWRLVMAPIEVIDYVVVHEICHIKQKDHSKRFWSLVENIIPDYKEKRKWLNDRGDYLVL